LWVGTSKKLLYSDGESWKTFSGLPDYSRRIYINKLTHKRPFNIIGNSTYHFFYGQDTVIKYISPKYDDRIVHVRMIGDSALVLTNNGLLLQVGEKIIDLGQQNPFLKQNIALSHWYQGEFWIATEGEGVFRLHKGKLIPVLYNNEQIFSENFLLENEATLWIYSSSGGGTYRVTKSNVNETSDAFIVECFASLSSELKFGPVKRDSSIFFLTEKNGIDRIEFEDLSNNPLQYPSLTFTSLTINGTAQPFLDTIHALRHDENQLTISYHGTHFTDKEIIYRYRILGMKDEWIETKERSLQLLSVPPGNYTFELQCKFTKQYWGESEFIRFNIAPPFWKRWWFILLYSLFALTIVYLIARYRIRVANREKTLLIQQLIADQKVLRAKMDPHFTFNIISSLHYLIGSQKTALATVFLEKYASLMRHTLDQTDHESIPLEQEVKFLELYIEMEQVRMEDKFEYTITLDDSINPKAEIPNFMLQPLVENAIHHGFKNKREKGLLQVTLSFEKPFVKVAVEDNGVGYNRTTLAKAEQAPERTAHGISTIKERLKMMNGKQKQPSFTIEDIGSESEGTTGTRVTMKLKTTK